MIDYKENQLYVGEFSVASLAAEYGTPLYVYSYQKLLQNCRAYTEVQTDLTVKLHYAIKANSNLSLLKEIEQQGFGFDVVSGGEYQRCLRVGADSQTIVYSGIGKSADELRLVLRSGIGCINVESFQEIARIDRIAQELNCIAPVAIRVNPHIDGQTHPYISTALADSKFGIDHSDTMHAVRTIQQAKNIQLKGLVCHIGSQIETLSPYEQACDSLITLYDELVENNITIEYIGLGGGLAIAYQELQRAPSPQELISKIETKLIERGLRLSLEPGRSIIANAGLVVTRTEYIKKNPSKNFVIVDAAMNDVPRPGIYQAWHRIAEVDCASNAPKMNYDVVGPICESTDFLGKDRKLSVEQGDLLAIFDTGAYNSSMASNYNSRTRAASVLIKNNRAILIQKRETFDDILHSEMAVTS